MPLQAVLLVLLGALIHAGWNIAAKKANGDARFTFFSCIIITQALYFKTFVNTIFHCF